MQKLFLWFLILFVGNFSHANFLCPYKCDVEKGSHDGQLIHSSSNNNVPDCIIDCPLNSIIPYYCAFLSDLSLSKTSPKTIHSLAKNLMTIAITDDKSVDAENNKLYVILRNFDTKACVQRTKLTSIQLNSLSSLEMQQKLENLMKQFKVVFEDKYAEFRDYTHLKKDKKKEKPSLFDLSKARNLFDWCQSYCTVQKTPKTFRSIEKFVKGNPALNIPELRDAIKNGSTLFSHSNNKYLTRSYKCLTECSIEKTKGYICYLLDSIDVENDETEVSRKILDLIAQIMLKSSAEARSPGSRLKKYLGNSVHEKYCLDRLNKYYYRGKNYSANIKYIRNIYGGTEK